jgi:hypothetical protein
VDGIGDLVGDPNLAAEGPEVRGSSSPVNPKDVALLARHDHVISKCANMVERDPVVVRCGAARSEIRKQRGDT